MFVKMVVQQARYKWPVTLLLWFAMASLVSLYVYLRNSAQFSQRSMQIIMKRMGFNLLILPQRADVLKTYLCSDGQLLFPEAAADQLAKHLELPSKYYLAVLQQRVVIAGRECLLTGVRPVHRADETPEKPHLFSPVPPGSAWLGSAAAARLKLAAGDAVKVLGREFKAAKVMRPRGTLDDYRVYIPLDEAQALLGRPGKVNAILAFMCMHAAPTLQGVEACLNRRMKRQFPDFRVLVKTDIARGRALARATTTRYLRYLLSLVAAVTMSVIVATGLQEVAERSREVGILLAMGANYAYVAGLYVAKLLGVALAASVVGFIVGAELSVWLLRPVLVANTRPVTIVWSQFPAVVGLTALVVLAAAVVPVAKLVRMDPNAILIEE